MYSTKTKAMRDINREIYLQSTIKATNNSSVPCAWIIMFLNAFSIIENQARNDKK